MGVLVNVRMFKTTRTPMKVGIHTYAMYAKEKVGGKRKPRKSRWIKQLYFCFKKSNCLKNCRSVT